MTRALPLLALLAWPASAEAPPELAAAFAEGRRIEAPAPQPGAAPTLAQRAAGVQRGRDAAGGETEDAFRRRVEGVAGELGVDPARAWSLYGGRRGDVARLAPLAVDPGLLRAEKRVARLGDPFGARTVEPAPSVFSGGLVPAARPPGLRLAKARGPGLRIRPLPADAAAPAPGALDEAPLAHALAELDRSFRPSSSWAGALAARLTVDRALLLDERKPAAPWLSSPGEIYATPPLTFPSPAQDFVLLPSAGRGAPPGPATAPGGSAQPELRFNWDTAPVLRDRRLYLGGRVDGELSGVARVSISGGSKFMDRVQNLGAELRLFDDFSFRTELLRRPEQPPVTTQRVGYTWRGLGVESESRRAPGEPDVLTHRASYAGDTFFVRGEHTPQYAQTRVDFSRQIDRSDRVGGYVSYDPWSRAALFITYEIRERVISTAPPRRTTLSNL